MFEKIIENFFIYESNFEKYIFDKYQINIRTIYQNTKDNISSSTIFKYIQEYIDFLKNKMKQQ